MIPNGPSVSGYLFTKELRESFTEMLARCMGLINGTKIISVEATRRSGIICCYCRITNHDAIFYRITFQKEDYKKHSMFACGSCYKSKRETLHRHFKIEIGNVFPLIEDTTPEKPMTIKEKTKRGIESLGDVV